PPLVASDLPCHQGFSFAQLMLPDGQILLAFCSCKRSNALTPSLEQAVYRQRSRRRQFPRGAKTCTLVNVSSCFLLACRLARSAAARRRKRRCWTRPRTRICRSRTKKTKTVGRC